MREHPLLNSSRRLRHIWTFAHRHVRRIAGVELNCTGANPDPPVIYMLTTFY